MAYISGQSDPLKGADNTAESGRERSQAVDRGEQSVVYVRDGRINQRSEGVFRSS